MYAVVVQVLQTGQEITELDTSGFVTSSPTVFAGNIGEKKYILQVCIHAYFASLCVLLWMLHYYCRSLLQLYNYYKEVTI